VKVIDVGYWLLTNFRRLTVKLKVSLFSFLGFLDAHPRLDMFGFPLEHQLIGVESVLVLVHILIVVLFVPRLQFEDETEPGSFARV
jgi:hypothetical protein